MSFYPGNYWPYEVTDISYHNGEMSPDVFLSKPMQAVGVRVGQGLVIDPKFRQHWMTLRGKVPRFGYFFFEPCTDAVAQANFLMDTLGADRGEITPFVDIEQNGDLTARYNSKRIAYPAFPVEEYFAMLMRFIARADMRLAVKPIGLYSRADFWDNNVPAGMRSRVLNRTLSIMGRKLWVANYYALTQLTASTRPRIPRDWAGQWDLWQCSADRPPNYLAREYGFLGSTSIDLSVVNAKTPQDFFRIFGINLRPETSSVLDTFPRNVRIKLSLPIRVDAGDGAVKSGWADPNSVWTVYNKKTDIRGMLWLALTPDGSAKPKWIPALNTVTI